MLIGKKIIHWLRDHPGPYVAAGVVKAYAKTFRVTNLGRDEMAEYGRTRGPYIVAHWHEDDLSGLTTLAPLGLTFMVSQSKDGDLLAKMMGKLGIETVRASTSKDSVKGFKAMIRLIKSGRSVGLTVDGPQGPRRHVHPGVVGLAKITGAPVYASASFADRRWVFTKTWHQTYLPKPFARIAICYDRPMFIDRRASAEEMEEARLEVGRRIKAMRLRARWELGVPD